MFASPRVKWEARFWHKNVYYIWVLLEWDDTTLLCLKLFTQGSEAIVPLTVTLTEADCTSPAGLWAQKKPTVKKQEIYWRIDTETGVSLSPTSPVCSANVSVWHLIKICTLCNVSIWLLLPLPQWLIKWSLITKLPACHKTWWLLFWDRRVLQGLDCKTNWSIICSYSV